MLTPMQDIRHLMSPIGPKPVGPFSHAVRANGFLFVTGQMPTAPDDPSTVVAGGIETQTRRALERIGETLAKYDLTHDAVVKCNVFLGDIDDFAKFNAVYRTFFKEGRYPARTTVAAKGLPIGAAIEIECIAHKPDEGKATAKPAPAQATPVGVPTASAPITPKLFDTWIKGRVGTGDPVYWYSVGTMRRFPDGKLIARMEGYDTARMHRPDPAKPLAHQYNRKIYVFRDPETGEVLREVDGVAVEPIAYPYQFITYELKDGGIETFVEQGAGEGVRRIGPGNQMSVRMLEDTAVFSAPVYLDFSAGPGKRYQAFENYDFFFQPDGSVDQPNQLSWVRYGPAPEWAGGVPTIMHLVTWRAESFDEVPESLRTYIEGDAPLWRAPPEDLADVRRLQGTEAPEGQGF
ncbi:MAG: Rid family detoxifying hydrolase [Pseudomonadota bacterium]